MSSRGDRRRALAAHKVAGTYVPRLKARPCFYKTGEIRDNRREEIAAMKQQIAAQRDHLNDRQWAYKDAVAETPGAVQLLQGIDIPVPSAPKATLPEWLATKDIAGGFRAAASIHLVAQSLFPIASCVQSGLAALASVK